MVTTHTFPECNNGGRRWTHLLVWKAWRADASLIVPLLLSSRDCHHGDKFQLSHDKNINITPQQANPTLNAVLLPSKAQEHMVMRETTLGYPAHISGSTHYSAACLRRYACVAISIGTDSGLVIAWGLLCRIVHGRYVSNRVLSYRFPVFLPDTVSKHP